MGISWEIPYFSGFLVAAVSPVWGGQHRETSLLPRRCLRLKLTALRLLHEVTVLL